MWLKYYEVELLIFEQDLFFEVITVYTINCINKLFLGEALFSPLVSEPHAFACSAWAEEKRFIFGFTVSLHDSLFCVFSGLCYKEGVWYFRNSLGTWEYRNRLEWE